MLNRWVSTFADRLNEALAIRNITPAELSRLTNISEGTISNYRKGKYTPKQKRLGLFAEALNVSVSWLLGADVPMEEKPANSESDKSETNTEKTFKRKGVKIPVLGEVAAGVPIEAIEVLYKADNSRCLTA